jgi:biotin carboxyl carrier protein
VEADPGPLNDREEALALLDELAKLLEGSVASAIEVETERLSVTVRRVAAEGPAAVAARPREQRATARVEKMQRVNATTVGIFSAAKEWRRGEPVTRGTVLGAIQSLGHVADITSPTDGTIAEVLVAIGAPVEYGQALFSIALR